jgi:signal transduction histidine kinase
VVPDSSDDTSSTTLQLSYNKINKSVGTIVSIMDSMNGWSLNLVLAINEPIPAPVAKTIPWSLLVLLLALAGYYSLTAYLEQKRRREIQDIAIRYQDSQTARAVYLNIISQYINTPITVMQGSLQIMEKENSLHEDVIMAVTTQLNKLADKTKKVLLAAQETSSKQEDAIRKIEHLKIPQLLSKPAIWLPIWLLLSLALLTNFIFIKYETYQTSPVHIFSQVALAVTGIFALVTSYYYYRKSQSNRTLLDEQVALEREYTEQQVRFIRQAHAELMEDITTLGFISEPITKQPRGSVFKEGINKLLHSMTKLSQLETIASITPTNTWCTNVNQVADDAISSIREKAHRAQIGLVVNVDPYLTANIDEPSLHHLIESTLDNAIKCSPAGSQVLLSIRAVHNGVLITVEDHGQGISKELQHHLLAPFVRASSEQFKYDGMGLDLYMCRLILDYCKGKIVIISEPGEGTTVQFAIPEGTPPTIN